MWAGFAKEDGVRNIWQMGVGLSLVCWAGGADYVFWVGMGRYENDNDQTHVCDQGSDCADIDGRTHVCDQGSDCADIDGRTHGDDRMDGSSF